MKTLVLLILITIVVTVVFAVTVEADRVRPPWMIVERKRNYGIGRTGLPEYTIKGRTLQGQRWSIFTYSTKDFETISPGLVYRCNNGITGGRWCPEGMIIQMNVVYIPMIYK